MYSEFETQRAITNEVYTLELKTWQGTITFKLSLKMDNKTINEYGITFEQLKDIPGLEQRFGDAENFKIHMSNSDNFMVNVVSPTISVYGTEKEKSDVIAFIPLIFVKTIKSEEPEDQASANTYSNPSLPKKLIQNINPSIPKKQQKENCMMLMLASSAKRQTLEKLLKYRSPLEGVNYDIDLFFDKFRATNHIYHLIETSLDEEMVLHKLYILHALQKYFRRHIQSFYLFYSGHGYQHRHLRGDIVLENQPREHGQQKEPWRQYHISLQDIVKVWAEKKGRMDSHLYIFMDSCYSGDWCRRLSQMNESSISIFTSCNSNEKAIQNLGGLFFKTILGEEQQFEENYTNLMYEDKQHPIFIRNSKKCSNLTKKHLKLLQMDIFNAKNFNSSSEVVSMEDFSRRHNSKEKDKNEINRLKLELEELIKVKQENSRLKKQIVELQLKGKIQKK